MSDDQQAVLFVAAGAVLIWYMSSHAQLSAASGDPGIPVYSTAAAPLSIYPEFGYTSMAATPNQKAATVQPQSYFTESQQQNIWAMQTQCIGSYPGCTPMLGDTSLGL